MLVQLISGILSARNMQISNSKLCEFVGEHAFPSTGFAVTWLGFRYSIGMMTTARPELPFPCLPRPRLGASLLGGGSNVTG